MTVLTFKNLVDETLDAMGFAGETGSLRTIVENAVRSNHERRVVGMDYPFMRMPKPSTFTVTAGQRVYGLSPLFRAGIYFRFQTTGTPLQEAKSDMLLENSLPLDTPTTPYQFELRGVMNVKTQPTTPAVVTVTPASAADNGKTVTVIGEDTDGNWTEETVTLAGAVSTTALFRLVFQVRKNGSTEFATALTVSSGATTLVTIPVGTHGTYYPVLYLLEAPAETGVVEYDFWRQPSALVNDNDLPNIPYPFSRILIYDALLETMGYSRPTADERQNWVNNREDLKASMDATYTEGQTNGALSSYVKLVPR